MKFKTKQIQKIIEILSKNQAVFIGSTIGIEYLTDYDKFLLKLNGIDIDDLDSISEIEKMFYFGIYSAYLGGNKSYKAKRQDFEKWFKKEIEKPKSIQQKAALDFLKQRAFTDISGLGNKITNKVNNQFITANVSTRNLLVKKVKKTSIKALKEGNNQQKLASMLREITEDWARDFSRISDYIMQEAYAYGRLAQIIDAYGEDVNVYKQTFPKCCKDCEKNYGVPGEEPKIYTIQELLDNGTNIGRKDQLPVIGQAHPWARSILHAIPPNSEWSDSAKRFVIKRNTQGVKRKSKAKITIT